MFYNRGAHHIVEEIQRSGRLLDQLDCVGCGVAELE